MLAKEDSDGDDGLHGNGNGEGKGMRLRRWNCGNRGK